MNDIHEIRGELEACKEVLGYLARDYLSGLEDCERKFCIRAIDSLNVATPNRVESDAVFQVGFQSAKRSLLKSFWIRKFSLYSAWFTYCFAP